MFPKYHRKYLLHFKSFNRKFSSLIKDGIEQIKMPDFMDTKEGTVLNWRKKVGDSFQTGELLCDITLGNITIGVEAKSSGVLAQIIVNNYGTAPINSPIAVWATSKDNYLSYLQDSMTETEDAALMAMTSEIAEEKGKKPDTKVLMRIIKHLIQTGSVEQGSEFAKSLQSLARKGDSELMTLFEASFEGISFNEETFDEKYFLDNVKDYVNELSSNSKSV